MKPTKNDPDFGWFSLADMAEAFGITSVTFSTSVRPLLAEPDVRKVGKRGVRVRCRAAIDAWAAHKVKQAVDVAVKKSDPLLVGSDSPALEEYRKHRARLAEMDVEQRELTHADLNQLNDALNRFSAGIRRGGDVLQRRFGPDAADVLNDAIDQAAKEWEARK